MKEKFKFLMFIDDDEATNFYHRFIVDESDICEKHIFYEKAEDALDYFSNSISEENIPDVIFLDINMPKIDGWMFLDRYASIPMQKSPIIIMLTTSLSPSDKEKADKNPLVKAFLNKPLSEEHLVDIASTFIKIT